MSREYPCIYFENDGKCRKFSDDNTLSYCVMGPCQVQTLSNADRIRAMNDEELARMLNRADCPPNTSCNDGQRCIKCWMEWLQQPAEED